METNLLQIMAYRESLDPRTGKMYTWQKHFDEIKIETALGFYKNLDKIVNLIPENERWNCHFTCANCFQPTKDKTVPLRLFHSQSMIPFDLDNIDMSKKDEYINLTVNALKIDPNKTFIGSSGNGLHLVVVLTKSFDAIELKKLQRYYKSICRDLSNTFYNAGLSGSADPVRLAESATLRLIGTKNVKDGITKESYVIQGNVEAQDFDLTSLIDLGEEKEIEQDLRAVDTKAVLSGCGFLKRCLEFPNSVTEPEWRSMLSTLVFIPDIGQSLCHTYSEKHSDYSYEATQTKLEAALAFGKPRLCDSISQLYPSCSSCIWKGKVSTPLQIKGDDFIATEKTGFHKVEQTQRGTKYTPEYSDLLKFFTLKNVFVVNKKTRQVSIFNGTHWENFTDLEIESFATKHFNPIANINKRSEFKALVITSNLVDDDFFGKDNSGFVNFKNGVLKLSDKTLVKHSPDFGFNYVLPYEYNPTAICPEFNTMLNNVTLNDTDMQNLLLEYVAYAISGMKASFGAKALILTGSGSNGKSTFLNIIKMLIGRDCFSTVSLEDMSDPNNRYSMVGRLFNICEEVEENELRKGTAMFKSIVTGADLMVKKLYSDTVSMRIDSKLILSCNDLPTSRENTYAIYRRMLIVPFNARFEKSTGIDKNIEERVALEMSGVYNRVLEAYDRFIKNNGIFSESETVNNALEEYKENNSFYTQFVKARLIKGKENDFLSMDDLMAMFKTWSESNNVLLKPTPQRLAKELKTLGMIYGDSKVKRNPGAEPKRGYYGIKRLSTMDVEINEPII